MKRTYKILILNFSLIIILMSAYSISQAQPFRSLGGQVRGPNPCTVLETAFVNYFPVTNTYGFMIDATQRAFLSDNQNLRWNIVKVGGPCSMWYGIETLIGHATASTPLCYADDKNQPSYFFESFDSYFNFPANTYGLWRTAKDGSGRIHLYDLPLGWSSGGCDFDTVHDNFVVPLTAGGAGEVRRITRAGVLVDTWNTIVEFGGFCGAVAVFADGRYALFDITNNRFRLYTGWKGFEIQNLINPMGAVATWFSIDNVRNRVWISRQGRVLLWDILSNTILVNHVWTVADIFQASYNPSDNYIYGKDSTMGAAPDNGRIWRYNYDTGVEQSWDGSQYVH